MCSSDLGFRLRYRHRTTWYEIAIKNPMHVCRGVVRVELDGAIVSTASIPLLDDGHPHAIRITLGPEAFAKARLDRFK